MNNVTTIEIEPVYVLMTSILVLFLGMYLNRKVTFLREFFIPPAVSGGLICSLITMAIYFAYKVEIKFDMQIRDVLLLVFFSTIGLSSKFRMLAAGGKALAIMVVISAVFLVIQNGTGVLVAMGLGAKPGYGLFGGSISFAGGHGTAIAWGKEAEAAGLEGAATLGIAFATFGLIAGGLLGGPVARYLIKTYDLKGPDDESAVGQPVGDLETKKEGDFLYNALSAILLLAICVTLGASVNKFLFDKGVLLPGFLTSMAVGILITNGADLLKRKFDLGPIQRTGDVALALFLAMSLMSMQLWVLATAIGPILLVLMLQMLVITLVAVYVVFRAMGRDYDACVISSGFVGLGLGATPVAIANMEVVTRRFGPSPKAFLVVPLIGGFFIDVLNALVLKFYIGVFS